MKKSLFILLGYFLFYPSDAKAQGILDLYVSEGLANNLVLKEKNIELDQSLLALKDAKSHFLPALEFGANYTLASGGRTIDFPIGDLLNPVYSTLNQLTGSTAFPQLENVSEQFLPDNFYDARFRASMPIYNRDLSYQKQIRTQQTLLSQYELATYRASLVQDIKVAYYTFCSTHTAVELIQSSKLLVIQNLKDNQSLLKNGKVLPAVVLRAESEVGNIEALLIDAQLKKQNAANYLNFLLNRPLGTDVIFEEPILEMVEPLDWMELNSLSQRPEILQLQTVESIQQTVLQSEKDFWIPKLNTYADFGSQAFDWRFDSQSRYLMWGFNLSLPIFQGGRNRTQIQRAQFGVQSLQNQLQLVNQKLQLELDLTKNEIRSQRAALHSAEKRLETASAYFRLVERGYREGVNSLIEFVDARNQYTQASLQKNLLTYQVLKSLAQLERQLSLESY